MPFRLLESLLHYYLFIPDKRYDVRRGKYWKSRLKQAGKDLKVGSNTVIKGGGYITVGDNVTIGNDVFIEACEGCPIEIGNDVYIDKGAILFSHSDLGKGLKIGNTCRIGVYNVLNAAYGLVIGNFVRIGPSVNINNFNHSYDNKDMPIIFQGSYGRETIIQDDCWIGTGATILGSIIGMGAVIGAGSVVTGDIDNYTVVAGVPARVIKKRGD